MASVVRLRNIRRALNIKPNNDPNLKSYVLGGRVSNFRPYKSFNFIDLNDGSTKTNLQVIVRKDLLKKPELGSYIVCRGSIVESRGSDQQIEFKADEIKYLSSCDPTEYPLATTSVDQLPLHWYRQFPHLRTRSPYFTSLMRVKSELELSIHMIMKQMDFFKVHTPSLSANDSEASSDLFIVKRSKATRRNKSNQEEEEEEGEHDEDEDDLDNQLLSKDSGNNRSLENQQQDRKVVERLIKDDYFKRDIFLVTSSQLHLESLVASLSRVYTLTTAFRAENSKSKQHLCEFQMFEAEETNVEDIEQLINRVETIIKFVAQFLAEVSEHNQDFVSLLELNENLENFKKLNQSYIRMTYREALDILGTRYASDFSRTKTSYGSDIGRLHERKLLDYCNNVPIFITNYPKSLKPFYMKCGNNLTDNKEEEAQCFDLIMPLGGEVCGGSLREDNCEKLMANLIENKRKLLSRSGGGGDNSE